MNFSAHPRIWILGPYQPDLGRMAISFSPSSVSWGMGGGGGGGAPLSSSHFLLLFYSPHRGTGFMRCIIFPKVSPALKFKNLEPFHLDSLGKQSCRNNQDLCKLLLFHAENKWWDTHKLTDVNVLRVFVSVFRKNYQRFPVEFASVLTEGLFPLPKVRMPKH